MTKKFITLIGPEDIINQIGTEQLPDGVEVGKSRSFNSLTDAVDAPLGPDEITAIFQVVSVAFSAGTSVLLFLEKLKKLLAKSDSTVPVKVVIKDGRSGKELVIVDNSTDIDEAVDKIVK